MRKHQLKKQLFFLSALAGGILTFLFLSGARNGFRFQADILFLPQNQIASEQIDGIMENATVIADQSSFRKKVLLGQDEFFSRDNNQSDVVLESRRVGESSVLRMTVTSKEKSEAERVGQSAIREMSGILSGYYDAQRELQVRLIEAPVFFSAPFIYWKSHFFFGTIFGLLFGWAFVSFLEVVSFFDRPLLARKNGLRYSDLSSVAKKTSDLFDWRSSELKSFPRQGLEEVVFGDKEKTETEREGIKAEKREIPDGIDEKKPDISPEKISESKKEKVKEKESLPVDFFRKSSAPDNLPVVDASSFKFSSYSEGTEEKNIPVSEKKDDEEKFLKEPTPEEVKERLNRLLRGEM